MNLSSHIVRFEDLGPAPSVTAFRDYTGDDEDAKKMWQAHMEKNVRCTRPTLEKFKLALARPGSVTYINETAEEGFAYVTVRSGSITEYAGATAAVERILRYLLKSSGWGVEVPPVSCSGPTEEMFLRYASGYGINTTAMVRVNSMCRVLNDYAPWLRRRLENWTGERIIELEDGEKVSIFRKGEAMVIAETNRIANVKLTRREVARLFFGPFMPDLGCQQEDDFWRLAFPLPLFWAGPDHV
jgi:hypothetical protein